MIGLPGKDMQYNCVTRMSRAGTVNLCRFAVRQQKEAAASSHQKFATKAQDTKFEFQFLILRDFVPSWQIAAFETAYYIIWTVLYAFLFMQFRSSNATSSRLLKLSSPFRSHTRGS